MNGVSRSFAATLVLCLGAAVGVASAQAPAGGAATAPDGAALYGQHCRRCHGARGNPTQRMLDLYPELKSLVDSAVMAHVTVDTVLVLMTKGRGDMKPLTDKMNEAEMRAVAQYVLTLRAAKP